jgi:DNA-directed RNA polymerase specialized sigma24 family protein
VEPKEFLSQYRRAVTDIENLETEAEELENMAMGITLSTESDRVQTSGKKDRMAELAAKAADIRIDIMGKRTEALEAMHRVSRLIAGMENNRYRKLLHMRYIKGATWEEIAMTMHYSIKHIYKLHGWALREIRSELKEETKCDKKRAYNDSVDE